MASTVIKSHSKLQATSLIIEALRRYHCCEAEAITVLTAVIEGSACRKNEYEKILTALKNQEYDEAVALEIIGTVAEFTGNPLRKWSTLHAVVDAVYVAGSIFSYIDAYMPNKDAMTTLPGMVMTVSIAVIAAICAKMAITGLPAQWEGWLLRHDYHGLYAAYQWLKINHPLIRRGISGIKNAVHAINVVTQNILPSFLHHFSFACMTSPLSIALGVSIGLTYALVSLVYDKWHRQNIEQTYRNDALRSNIQHVDASDLYLRQHDPNWLKWTRLVFAGLDGFLDGLYIFNCGHQDASFFLRLLHGVSSSATVSVCSAFSFGAPLIALACVAIAWAGVCAYRNIQKERQTTKANDVSVKKLNETINEQLAIDKNKTPLLTSVSEPGLKAYGGNQKLPIQLPIQSIRDEINGVKNATAASSTVLKNTDILRDSQGLACAGLVSVGFYGYVRRQRRVAKAKISQGVKEHYREGCGVPPSC